jgi:DNA-binding transcriptional regulator YiaG
MSDRRLQKEYVDHGFGFPIKLRNVPMVKVRGTWTPNLNYEVLADAVLKALCFKPVRLTGSEIRFIRLKAEMTLQAFAQRFGVTHPSVIKWEKQTDEPTKMSWSTEKDIRLFALLQTEDENQFLQLYRTLDREKPLRKRTSSIDIASIAA